jgi:hypothetical protein
MNRNQTLLTALMLFLAAGFLPGASAAELTYRVEIQNTSGSALSNVPVTFGHPFLRGDVPSGQTLQGILVGSNAPIDIQVDKKATHKDGSLRHAVVSMVIPSLAGRQALAIELVPASTGLTGSAVARQELIDSKQAVQVDLKLGDQVYRATLAAALENPVDQWLSGPLASEWITYIPFRRTSDGQPHSDLKARFYARKYAGTDNVKVDVVVENLTTFVGTRNKFEYAAEIRVNGNVVYTKPDIIHFRNARWKYTFWTQNTLPAGKNSPGAPPVHVAFDPATLMATMAIPNYDPRLIGEMTGQPDYNSYANESYITQGGDSIDRYGPMGRGGNGYDSMSTTGARIEIAPLPDWAVNWLLTQTPASKLALLRDSDLAGSWSMHYRDENTGRAVTIDEAYGGYPEWGVDSGSPKVTPVSASSGSGSGLSQDTSHQPQFNFLPYLVTGDFYHFEELEFWSAYNLAEANPGSVAEPDTASGDGYRNQHKGLITNRGQLRGRAWNLRTLAMTAAFTPDNYYTKRYWDQILENNLERYYWRYATKNNYGYGDHRRPDGTQPWMDDYMTWALAYTLDQGYENARVSANWKSLFPVARMGQGSLNSNWCWQAATDFKLGLHPDDGSLWPTINDWWAAYMPDAQGMTCNTKEIASAIGVSGPGDMRGRPESSSSYVAQMGMALGAAVDLGVEGARDAWDIYGGATGERNAYPDFRGSPRFAIVPRTYQPEMGSRPRAPKVSVE